MARARSGHEVVLVAGNHDQSVEAWGLPEGRCHYLEDSGAELFGLKLWGTPWQPWFHDWAFNAPRRYGDAFLASKFERIPAGTDVVICHGPPRGIHAFEQRLRDAGFREDQQSTVICRWRHGPGDWNDLVLDVMAADATLLGSANRWQVEARPHAVDRRLPSGLTIRAASPPYLVATKLEAFRGRCTRARSARRHEIEASSDQSVCCACNGAMGTDLRTPQQSGPRAR